MFTKTEEVKTPEQELGTRSTHQAKHGHVQSITLVGGEAFPAVAGI